MGNSNTKSILRAGASMVNVTEANRKSLSDIGISIGADNKLTIDEEKFKKADMSKVKAMFADNSYYGTEVKRQAGRAESYAKSEALSLIHILFLRCKISVPFMTESFSKPAERKHIAVRVTSFCHMVLPELTAVEHIF